jgi:flagellar biosynthetic protein FliP
VRKFFLLVIVFAMYSGVVSAAESLPAVTVTTGQDGSQTYSVTIQILALMTALTFIPAALIMMTSFTRIIIVLGILRQALGMPTTPSNQTIIGLSLFLTIFIMGPVFERINTDAIQPYLNDKLTLQDAAVSASKPLKDFMLGQTRNDDLALFVRMSGKNGLESRDQVPFQVLVPAFVTSELKTAFQIGFLLFIPFLIIDLVVASVLMSMGMMMLSPMIISLPFKLMLFVLVDGWNLIMGTLATSFYVQ